MKKDRTLTLNSIILLLIAFICNMFFASKFVVYASNKEDEEIDIPVFSVWDGSLEVFNLSNPEQLNSESNPYIIDNAKKFAYLATMVNSGTTFENEYLKVTVNIDLNNKYDENANSFGGINWNSIGYKDGGMYYSFNGIIDFCNNRIINLGYSNTSVSSSSYGLFGYTKNATIKNLVLNGNFKISSTNVGLLVGYAENTNIENCEINGQIFGTNTNVGLFIGQHYTNNDSYIKSCFINGSITNSNSGSNVGGLIGVIFNGMHNLDILNCNVNVTIEANSVVAGVTNVLECSGEVNIKNCIFSGKITAGSSNNVGGILGINSNAKVENCINYGDIEASCSNVAGIVGNNSGIIYNSKNYGTISGLDNTAGIAGITYNQITNCSNNGEIFGQNYVAGVAGVVLNNGSNFDFKCNYNLGVISGDDYVAGVVAKLDEIDIKYSFNLNLQETDFGVVGQNYVAGIVAYINKANIKVCYNTANIKAVGSASGIVCQFIGTSTRNNLKDFYFIGKVKGETISGVMLEGRGVSVSNGYALTTLEFVDSANYSNSGAIAGSFTNTTFSSVYFDEILCQVPHGTNSLDDDIIATNANEIQNGKLEEITAFYYYNDVDLDKSFYYDYYPFLRGLFFDVYSSDSANYFIDSSAVQNFTKKSVISKVYNTVTITLVTNNDEEFNPIYVKQNVDLTSILPKLSKTGFDFDGWYLDSELTTKLDLKSGLTESATLYAKFVYPKATFPWWIFAIIFALIIFALGGTFFITSRKKIVIFKVEGSNIEPLKVKVGTDLVLPIPSKDGFTFDGWYYNEELTKKFELVAMPNINLVLFGKFVENKVLSKKKPKNNDNVKVEKENAKPKLLDVNKTKSTTKGKQSQSKNKTIKKEENTKSSNKDGLSKVKNTNKPKSSNNNKND